MTTNNQSRQTWSSRLTYVLTVAGATVGFGATWRFPYLVGENGGGAYVLLFLYRDDCDWYSDDFSGKRHRPAFACEFY